MNDENHEFDPRLEKLFRREHTHLPEEPFATAALRAVAAERRRATLTTWLLQAAAVVALVALSPVLVSGWSWVAPRLDALSASLFAWAASPLALAGAALLVLAGVAAKWARLW